VARKVTIIALTTAYCWVYDYLLARVRTIPSKPPDNEYLIVLASSNTNSQYQYCIVLIVTQKLFESTDYRPVLPSTGNSLCAMNVNQTYLRLGMLNSFLFYS